MRGWLRRLSLLALSLMLLMPVMAAAARTDQTSAIEKDLIAYYFHWRGRADREIENQLETLTSLDPGEGALWRQIMESWDWVNTQMPVADGCLSNGLPGDDSLCIVVLGYGLREDGSMKPELVDRLEVALKSAEKYPESYVLCTGGETAGVPGVSEAGQMGNWLLAKGLAHNRLILETGSLSTTENARNSLQLLWRDYPQITSIALVSSDYHIPWGAACFETMALCGLHRQGKPEIRLAGTAACATASPARDTMYSQAWGISILTDIPFDSSYVPPLYMTDQPVPAELPAQQPAPAAETPAPAEKTSKEPVIPVLLGLAAVTALIFLPKKRKQSGS